MVMMILRVALGIKREIKKVLTKVSLKGEMEIKVVMVEKGMENNKKEEIKNNSTKEDE